MYDYYLGGKNHFAADRETADKMVASARVSARENRGFLGRAVRYLAAEAGVRQFLDIGSGLPTTGNVHEVAQDAAPESRVVYVDNDPLVLAHARALLTSAPEGRTAYMAAALLPRASRKEAVGRGYDFFEVLGRRRKQTAGTLSGGEQQMLSLARTLILNPLLVIADEMSLGLAPRMVDTVFAGLAQAREAGVTVLLIEQFVHRALAYADDCVILSRGQAAWNGPATDAKDEVLHRYLGATAEG
jgi:ABC-type multidrug transport system ATPase subunit